MFPSFSPIEIRLTLPPWVEHLLENSPPCRTDEEKMRLAISLARENVIRERAALSARPSSGNRIMNWFQSG